jgi:hypothetical protein
MPYRTNPCLQINPCLQKYLTHQARPDNLDTLPTTKCCVVVYHPRSRSYFASVTSKPKEYFTKLFKQLAGLAPGISAVIANMQKSDNVFEFFTMHPVFRNEFEQTATQSGITRKATALGTQASVKSIIVAVHNSNENFTRYLSVPQNTPVYAVLSLANIQLMAWLNSRSHINQGFRHSAKARFRTIVETENSDIFDGHNSFVYFTNLNNTVPPHKHRAVVRELNIKAVVSALVYSTEIRMEGITTLYAPVEVMQPLLT